MSIDHNSGATSRRNLPLRYLLLAILAVSIAAALVMLILIVRTQRIQTYDAMPATRQLGDEVRNATKIVDTLNVSHSGVGYQLDVLVNKDQQASFAPIGLQLRDDSSSTPVATTSLNLQTQLSCFHLSPIYLSKVLAYETPWLTGNQFSIYAYKPKKSVTLIVKTTNGTFAVDGLGVTDYCSWMTE